jgi:transposase
VRNDAAGWAELVARLRGFAIAAIGLEASGGYERGAMRALLAAGNFVVHAVPLGIRVAAPHPGCVIEILRW